jgi:hypothetical protein
MRAGEGAVALFSWLPSNAPQRRDERAIAYGRLDEEAAPVEFDALLHANQAESGQ